MWKRRLTTLTLNLTLVLVLLWMRCCALREARRGTGGDVSGEPGV